MLSILYDHVEKGKTERYAALDVYMDLWLKPLFFVSSAVAPLRLLRFKNFEVNVIVLTLSSLDRDSS